jgi:hypothetical protein
MVMAGQEGLSDSDNELFEFFIGFVFALRWLVGWLGFRPWLEVIFMLPPPNKARHD